MTDIIKLLKDNLVNDTSLNRIRENIIENTNAEDIEKAKLQINYQLICTALEKAIIETFVNYPNAESTNYLNFRITIFLFGLFLIIFSETSIKLIGNDLNKNFIIILIPIFLYLIIYSILFYNLRLKFKR